MPYSPERFLQIARTSGIEAARSYKASFSAPPRRVGPQPRRTAPKPAPAPRTPQRVGPQPRRPSAPEVPRITISESGFAQPLIQQGQLVPTTPPRADVSTGFLRAQPQPAGAVPPGVQRALTRNFLFATTPAPGALPPNLSRFVAGGGGPFAKAPEGTLPPNLSRFVASGGGPFRIGPRPPGLGRFLQSGGQMSELPPRIFERRQPPGVLPVSASRFVKSGGKMTELPFGLPPAAPQPARMGAGIGGRSAALGEQLLELAATDPERLRERARFINLSRDRGAQIDVGVALTAEAMARGQFPDVMTDTVAGSLADLYGYSSVEEMMADLGYLPNPDAPGTWLRREPTAPGTFGTGAGGSGGFGGGRQPIFVQGAVPRATRGGGFSLGLTSWGIQPGG